MALNLETYKVPPAKATKSMIQRSDGTVVVGTVTLRPASAEQPPPPRQPPPPKDPPPQLPPGAPRPLNPVCQGLLAAAERAATREVVNPCIYPQSWNGIVSGWSSEASAGDTQGSLSSTDPESNRTPQPMPQRPAPRNDDAKPEEVFRSGHDTTEHDRYHQQRYYDNEKNTYMNQETQSRSQ